MVQKFAQPDPTLFDDQKIMYTLLSSLGLLLEEHGADGVVLIVLLVIALKGKFDGQISFKFPRDKDEDKHVK